jgi:hypothetical protein
MGKESVNTFSKYVFPNEMVVKGGCFQHNYALLNIVQPIQKIGVCYYVMLRAFESFLGKKGAIKSQYVPFYIKWVSDCYHFLEQPPSSCKRIWKDC